MKMQILSLCVSRYSIHNTFIHFILLCFCISLAASGCTCSTKNYVIFFAKIENQKQQFKKKGRVRICQQILIVSLISFNKIFVCILLSSSQCTQFLREISFFCILFLCCRSINVSLELVIFVIDFFIFSHDDESNLKELLFYILASI
jgi:hypothetical protein